MAAYYNEFDPFAAGWLKELIKAGLIADGEVDTRSIVDVRSADLVGFQQCHFFAGIGGWSYALRLAGWPDDRQVWTGSCPCQPFSVAGAQLGAADPRDLWPRWFQFVPECKPVVVFGEQVEAAIKYGWFDRLCDDMEREGYAVGACCLPAASVGAFHGRSRLFFVADTQNADGRSGERRTEAGIRSDGKRGGGFTGGRAAGELADATLGGFRIDGGAPGQSGYAHVGGADGLVDAFGTRLEGHAGYVGDGDQPGRQRTIADRSVAMAGESCEFWDRAEWIACRDGKARPVEPGFFPLAHGISARVGRLRGYGNAIVPQVAAEVIRAYMEIRS